MYACVFVLCVYQHMYVCFFRGKLSQLSPTGYAFYTCIYTCIYALYTCMYEMTTKTYSPYPPPASAKMDDVKSGAVNPYRPADVFLLYIHIKASCVHCVYVYVAQQVYTERA